MITLENFLDKVKNGEAKSFNETILVITENYNCYPTEFSNGLDDKMLVNPPGTNEGSCKIFAFAKLHGLDKDQTLSLFGDFYRIDVLQNPGGDNHQNIRRFMEFGWDGINFQGKALESRPKV